ncbi:hypothetical protein [Haloquadratum walsbyi]|jgi:hypothetical protein|uniref:Uncharacterized protein n=1 Tax=Haloquadratum walsbyi J07HQW2 TaxID=1238425 RepID=U1PXP7_9EURY|nr:hypothetical protein [Haloquadratum walsbyi]ERG97246.1 MAG: hypothetical protein J07HQW2_03732 [Haloquadratum walsbyi J07HQW2]
MLSFSSSASQSLDTHTLDGVRYTEDQTQFDLTVYGRFVEVVAGVKVADDLPAKEHYRIRNRIEAFIHDAKRYDIWTPELLEVYPNIDSLSEVTALARALRQHEKHHTL